MEKKTTLPACFLFVLENNIIGHKNVTYIDCFLLLLPNELMNNSQRRLPTTGGAGWREKRYNQM